MTVSALAYDVAIVYFALIALARVYSVYFALFLLVQTGRIQDARSDGYQVNRKAKKIEWRRWAGGFKCSSIPQPSQPFIANDPHTHANLKS